MLIFGYTGHWQRSPWSIHLPDLECRLFDDWWWWLIRIAFAIRPNKRNLGQNTWKMLSTVRLWVYGSSFFLSFFLPSTSSAVSSPNLWLTKRGKAINITVTIHLLSSILMEDDKLWSARWDAVAHFLHPHVCVRCWGERERERYLGKVVSFIHPESDSITQKLGLYTFCRCCYEKES